MANLLLLNPRRRRAKNPKRRRSAAQVAAFRKMISARRANPHKRRRARAANPIRRRARRANPIFARRRVHHRRRRNPIFGRVRHHRRRRNPSMGGLLAAFTNMAKPAAIGAVGAFVMDYLWGGFINPTLGAQVGSLMTAPSTVGAGDAVKAALTVALGHYGKGVTKGMSETAAVGALVTQFYKILVNFMPSSITTQLGSVGPAAVVNGQMWTGPNASRRGVPLRLPGSSVIGRTVGSRNVPALGAYLPAGGPSPLLSAYLRRGGPTPLLSGLRGAPGVRSGTSAIGVD